MNVQSFLLCIFYPVNSVESILQNWAVSKAAICCTEKCMQHISSRSVEVTFHLCNQKRIFKNTYNK